ncbi:MAG: RNA polymerase sigma factor [Bacteroidales bacterium]
MMTNGVELIIGLKRGDYGAFRILYETHADHLKGFIFKLCRSEEIAEDITQETFLKVWSHHRSIDETLSFKAYIFRIAQNLLVDEIRRTAKNPLFEDYMVHCENLAMSHNNVDQELDFEDFLKNLQNAKEKLTPRQKEIFELSKETGASIKEISTKLDITERSVYNHLYSSLQIIREELAIIYFTLLMFNIS